VVVSLKFLHIADLHIGRYLKDVSLLEDQETALNELVSIIMEEDPQVLIVAGDVYDRSVPREEAVRLYNSFLTRLAALPVKTLLITGNHDSSERVQVLNSLLEDHGLHIEGYPKNPLRKFTESDAHGPVEFYFLPYKDAFSLKATYGLEHMKDDSEVYRTIIRETLGEGNTNRKVMIYHGFVTPGSKEDMVQSDSERLLSVGGTDFIRADVFDDFHYVALGHLHKPQWVTKGRIRYSGSLMKYSFSEENHMKSVSVLDMDAEGKVTLKERFLTQERDVVTLKGEFSTLLLDPTEDHRDDYVRIILTNEEEVTDPVERLRTRYTNLIELVREKDMKAMEQDNVDFSIIQTKDISKLFREFYAMKNSDMEPDEAMVEIIQSVVRELGEENHETN
jgi:exonuclease SbcD